MQEIRLNVVGLTRYRGQEGQLSFILHRLTGLGTLLFLAISLKKLGIPFHVATDTVPAGPGWNAEGHTIIPVTAGEVAGLVARATRYLIF